MVFLLSEYYSPGLLSNSLSGIMTFVCGSGRVSANYTIFLFLFMHFHHCLTGKKAAAILLRPWIDYSPTALLVSMVWISFRAEGFAMAPGCSPMRRTFFPAV